MTTIKPKSSIEIYTDKEQYTSGDVVSGKVLLKIKKEMKAKDLFIALTGEIFCKTHVHTLEVVKAKWIDIDIQEERKPLLHLKSKLYTFEDQKLKKGEFNVKFNFALPDYLEYASMHCKGSYGLSRDSSQHYQQHVKYNLMAWVPKSKKKQFELVGKQIIHIKKDHNFNLPPQIYMRKEFNFLYCFTVGHLDLGLKLEKTSYKASEQLKFEFDYDNYPPQDKKPISLRWAVVRKLIFKGKEYNKPYIQGELENCLAKSHKKAIELPMAMTMTHKSQFVEVKNVFQIEYCLPNDVFIPVCQEFSVTHTNPPQRGGEDDSNASVGSRLSDVNREEMIASEVNWNKCNSKLEELG